MKKIFSFLLAGLFCTSLSAQKLEESFEGEQFAPEGWVTIDTHAYSRWMLATSGGYDGSQCAIVAPMEGASNYLITPALRPQAGDKLRFFARILDDYAKGGSLRIEISHNTTAPEDFDIEVADLPTSSSVEGMRLYKEWRGYELDLSDDAGEIIYIAFHYVGNGARVALDAVSGVTLAGNSECLAPFNLSVSAITAGSATFSWEGDAAQFQYMCLPAGTSADWSEAVKTSDKSVTISDLVPSSEYNFFVRSFCSDELQSLAPYVAFTTPCEAVAVPWVETFTGHPVSSGFNVVHPECWVVASESNNVAVVISKSSGDDYEESSTIPGTEHLYITGGGPNSEQVFAMPLFDTPLNTLEVAFDYYHNFPAATYGTLEVGHMTNPTNAASFVALKAMPLVGSWAHEIFVMENLPAGAQIAFRYAGGSYNTGALHMDNFVVAPIGHSDDYRPQGIENTVDGQSNCRKFIENGVLIIEQNGVRYNAQGAVVK